MKIKENEKRDEYLDLARELKKLWNMKMTVIPIERSPNAWYRELEELEIERSSKPQHCQIGQNIEKNPGDMRRVALPQTPVKAIS